MARVVLDTSVLISHWNQCRGDRPYDQVTTAHAVEWARRLIQVRKTDRIVTPVYVEFLAGALSGHQLELMKAYLEAFNRIDNGHTADEDWDEAIRLAQRVPPSGKARDLGDCLICAISRRLRHCVDSFDATFPC